MSNAVETFRFSSSSSSPSFKFSINEKPLILRVKRKASQPRFEALWLEINGRPLKQTLLDFQKLSISDSTGKGLEIIDRPLTQTLSDFGKLSISDLTGKGLEINERSMKRPLFDFGKLSISDTTGKGLEINERPIKRPLLDFGKLSISDFTGKADMKTKRFFMQVVETISSFEATIDVLQSFMSKFTSASEFRTKIEERRHIFKKDNDLAVDPSSDGHIKQAGEKCNHDYVVRDHFGDVCCICGLIDRGKGMICDLEYIMWRNEEKDRSRTRSKKNFHSRTSRRRHRFRYPATRGLGARTTTNNMFEYQNTKDGEAIEAYPNQQGVRTTTNNLFEFQNTKDREATEAYPNPQPPAKNARFEQIRRRRKGREEVIYDELLREFCHIYDIVHVDIEETSNEMEVQENISLEDKELLSGFLSLIKEHIPSAAAEIESEFCASSEQGLALSFALLVDMIFHFIVPFLFQQSFPGTV
ncbi:hypothetical protein L1049_008992 [Liquidambar formosana]|uniref:Uncharacterized protein n=1 Tax=Liquidambar formosana TaxID=63359 RepID=A0AAP0X2M6_LIQFO